MKVGQRIGDYVVGARLGRGGMGAVHVAQHRLVPGLEFALKEMLYDDPDARRRFLREASYGLQLDHPNIVRTFMPFEHEGVAYLVLERLKGGPLEAYLPPPEEPWSAGSVIALLYQAASGLQFALEAPRNIVHRDVTPGNLFLVPARLGAIQVDGTQFQLKIIDFGLAKQAGSRSLTAGSLGTAIYCAPEAFKGQAAQAPGDVYALGLMAYRLLTGTLPYPTDGDPAATILGAHVAGLPPLRDARPDAPRWLAKLCDQMLASEPAARPSLDATLQRLEGHEVPVSARTKLRPPAANVAPPPAPAPLRRARPWGAVAALAVGLLVGAVSMAGLVGPSGVSAGEDAAEALTVPPEPAAEAPASPAPDESPKAPKYPASADLKLVDIPKGKVWYGCIDPKATGVLKCDGDETSPAERRTVPGFSIMASEVTADAHQECIKAGACKTKHHRTSTDCTYGKSGQGQHPMNCVAWQGAVDFCGWWGRFVSPERRSARLPYEDEFERAARGEHRWHYTWGNTPYAQLKGRKVANIADVSTEFSWREKAYDDGYAQTAPVKQFEKGGAFDVYDLLGNVWEWQQSCYKPQALRPKNDAVCQSRSIRGGSWGSGTEDARASYRGSGDPANRGSSIGFRCAQSE